MKSPFPDSVADTRPARGHYLDPTLARLSGIERAREYVRGNTGLPAIHHLTGLRPTEASQGRSTFAVPATGWLASSAGIIPGGALAFLTDAPLSSAIETVLGPNRVATTSELSLNFIAPAFPGEGNLVARAGLIDVGSVLGFSSAEVTDQHGRLVAHATTRCVVMELPDQGASDQPRVDPDWVPDDTPDPWRLPPGGDIVDDLHEIGGLEALQAWVAGRLPRPPIAALFGFFPVRAEEGRVAWAAPSSPWYSSPGPFLYGGAIALLAETAHAAAFHSVLGPGEIYANLDLKIQFLRPARAGAGFLTATAEVVHRGRSILVANARIEDSTGKTILLATGSAAVIAGGIPWLLAQRPHAAG